jgi:aminoglycoside/choline kinase family phosphotransferase
LLLGDGSNRSFYRVETEQQNFILVSDPHWTQTQDYPAHQEFLKTLSLPVPEFFVSDPKQGFLLMQDLGDELLQTRIQSHPSSKMVWLEQAIRLLGDLHGKSYPVPKTLPAASRFFDAEKYLTELLFTFEYLHQKLLNLPKISDSTRHELSRFCQIIAQIEPGVFSHRDYHCRNLLVQNDQVWIIDFQDARIGSPHYDVASLVYDAYLPLSNSERELLINAYKSQLSQHSVSKKIAWHIFESDLKQVAFQRTIKAAGSFASFFIRFGKTTHWPYLVPALRSALSLQQNGFGVKSSVVDIEKWIALISKIQLQ